MKGCLQLNLLYGWKDFHLKLDLKLGPLDQQASASPIATEAPQMDGRPQWHLEERGFALNELKSHTIRKTSFENLFLKMWNQRRHSPFSAMYRTISRLFYYQEIDSRNLIFYSQFESFLRNPFD